jgi:hypothetical protein
MRSLLAALITLVLAPPLRAERFNGQPVKDQRVPVDCFDMILSDVGKPAKLVNLFRLDTTLTAREAPCAVEPFEFRIVDSRGKQHDVRSVGRMGARRGQEVMLLPGASKEAVIVFGRVRLDSTKPALLYYRVQKLGEITK